MSENPSVAPVVDAVFVIGTGSKNNNEELRYALRNLDRNCPFIRDVYISGECPEWIDKSVVKHLKWPDRFTHAKDANIIDKLRHACEEPGISENILFCSDDQFQTRTCTWDDFRPRWLRRYSPSDGWYEAKKRIWHSRLHKTLERDRSRRIGFGLNPDDVFYYQPHMWMQINRDKFIEYAKWSEYEKREDTIIASGYFNYADAGGESNFDHVFISQSQKWPVNETHVAYSDTSYKAAMEFLHRTFPNPSRFEIGHAPIKSSPDIQTTTAIPQKPRTDEEIIEELKEKVSREPAWTILMSEIEVAEKLRKAEFVGWRKVWNDIIHRWADVTDKGRLRVPVLTPKSEEAKEILARFMSPKAADVKEESPEETNDPETPAPEPAPKKKCSKCEERRRRAREAAERRRQEAAMKVQRLVSKTEPEQEEDWACLDCAIEHLAVAIAYMNSNAGRPETFDVEMAKGEVAVASQHLLALDREELYNRCIQTLDSAYTENSEFSVKTLRDILRSTLES